MMNAYSKPKNIVRGVTIQKQEKSIAGREKLKFSVTNQAVNARQRRVGNVERVTDALAR
jgi:hypothetical protein